MPRTFFRRPEAPLRAALLLSVLAHLAILNLVRLPTFLPQARPGTGATLLTVELDAQSMAAAYPQPPSPQEETLPHTLFDIPPAPPAAAPAPPQPDIQAPEVALPAPETGTALQQPAPPAPAPPPVPAFVDRRPPALQEGMATAVLHVDDHGHVQQIIWLVLPYVTFEELQQMETELRQRQYPATGAAYNLAEAIQVPRARPPVSTADP